MKRIIAFALFLALFVPVHMAEANNFTDIPYIRINGLRNVTSGYSMNVTNFTNDDIYSITVAIVPYDSSNTPLVTKKSINGIYTTAYTLNKLKKYGHSTGMLLTIDRSNFSYVELAIVGYTKSGFLGDEVVYPEREWAWYSTKTNEYLNFPKLRSTYRKPELSAFQYSTLEYELKSQLIFNSGKLEGYYLNQKYANLLGYHHCGVIFLVVDSMFDGMIYGGDLLWAVDDREYIDDPYLRSYFLEKLMFGNKKATLHIERNGEDIEVVLSSK